MSDVVFQTPSRISEACVQGIYAELIVMEPYPFQPHTFGRMLPYVDSDQSVALFEEFRAVGLIDERGFGQMPQYHESVERWYLAQPFPSAALSAPCTAMPGPADEQPLPGSTCHTVPQDRMQTIQRRSSPIASLHVAAQGIKSLSQP